MEKKIIYRPERPAPSSTQLEKENERLANLLNTIQLSNWSRKSNSKVLFLDFDGPLAIPWTVNEDYWPHIPDLINEIASRVDVTLCLVSFNPGAELAVTRWGIRNCFKAVRAGCNRRLEPGEKYTEELRKDLSKSAQIISILNTELRESSHDAGFFDDDAINLMDVYRTFNGEIKCFYIYDGLSRSLVDKFLN